MWKVRTAFKGFCLFQVKTIQPMSMALRPRRVVHVTCSVPMHQTTRRQNLDTMYLSNSRRLNTFDASKTVDQSKKKTYWVSESAMYDSVKHIARRNRQKVVNFSDIWHNTKRHFPIGHNTEIHYPEMQYPKGKYPEYKLYFVYWALKKNCIVG